MNLFTCLNTLHLIILSSSSVSSSYVDNCWNTRHLIILFIRPGRTSLAPWSIVWRPLTLIIPSLHPSPAGTWTCSMFWKPLIWLSHPSSSSVFRVYVNIIINCLNTLHLIMSSHPLRKYVNLVNSLKTPRLIILSHHLQPVRELGQSFEYPSSDYVIPSSQKVHQEKS
jgi:hypothetical protein